MVYIIWIFSTELCQKNDCNKKKLLILEQKLNKIRILS